MSRTLNNLGLFGGFATGEDDWGDEMNANLLAVSTLAQGVVGSSVASLPGSPTAGQTIRLTAGANNKKIGVYDNSAWVYFVPLEGWEVYDQGADKKLRFDGTNWAEVTSSGGLPTGGTTGQVLTKNSETDGDADWTTPSGGGGGGGSLDDAPSDGKIYGRRDGEWVALFGVSAEGDGHRYWRIRQSATHDFNCTRLDLHAVVGGSNVATGGTASAASIYSGGYPASNAFDNNSGTFWAASTATSDTWLAYDFGSSNLIDIVEIVFLSGNSGGGPLDLQVEFSDDGAAWTTSFALPAVPTFATYTGNASGWTAGG